MGNKLLTLLLLFAIPTCFASNIYFAKVLRVDNHNVLHLVHDGELQAVSLGYINTPIKGEVFHEKVNKYLVDNLLEKWVRVTELTYGRNAIVKPALIRTRGLVLINKEVLEKGLGVPNLATNPPNAIIVASENAHGSKVGLWGKIDEFKVQRNSQGEDRRIKEIMDGFTESLVKVKSLGINPYVGDKKTKKAYRLACISTVKNQYIFATQYVAINNGFTLIENSCPKKDKLNN